MHLDLLPHITLKAAENVRWSVQRGSLPILGTMKSVLKDLHYISDLINFVQNARKSYTAANCSALFTSTPEPCCDLFQRSPEVREV
jgi:hypothetical protein